MFSSSVFPSSFSLWLQQFVEIFLLHQQNNVDYVRKLRVNYWGENMRDGLRRVTYATAGINNQTYDIPPW